MASYKLKHRIATGGMAEVFLAKQTGIEGFEKPVAIKRVLPSMAQDPRFIEMFLREAKLTVALQHANVVQVLDLGTMGGQYFMVMEFVDGENLKVLLQSAAKRSISLGLREILFITQQVAEGLSYAHQAKDGQGQPLNVIHRDVNPANVMISRFGEVKLADFGIAKAADFNAGTEVGTVKGKAGYLAPEQISGAPPDQRCDIFLLGLLLYEVLTGTALFAGGTNYFQILRTIAQFDPRTLKLPPGVPAPVWAILLRALAKDPAARFQRAHDFSDALHSFLFDHRLKVGNQEVASLFTKIFPERKSPLEMESSHGAQELRLEPAALAPAPVNAVRPAAAAPPLIERTGARPVLPPRLSPEPSRPAPAPVARPGLEGTRSHLLPAPRAGAARPAELPGVSGEAPSPPTGPRLRMGEMLVAQGKLTEPQLTLALKAAKESGARLGDVLIHEGLVLEDDVIRAIGEQRRVRYITGETLKSMPTPPEDVLARIPVEKAERWKVLPIGMIGKVLQVATCDPSDLSRLDSAKFAAGVPVSPLLVGEAAFRMALRRFYLGEEPPKSWGQATAIEQMNNVGGQRFADRHTGTREQLFGETELELEESNAPSPATPPAAAPVVRPGEQLTSGRSVLLITESAEGHRAVIAELSRGGYSVATATPSEAPAAMRNGVQEFVLAYSRELSDLALPASIGGSPEVRVLTSAADALVGESCVSDQTVRTLNRLLETAVTALGGEALSAPLLSRIATRICRQLRGSGPAADLAATLAYSVALAGRLTPEPDRAMPSASALRAMLGVESGGASDLLQACESGVLTGQEGPTVQAVWAAAHFVHRLAGAAATPELTARALTQLRQAKVLPPSAMEALAAIASENVIASGSGATVVLLTGDSRIAAAVQSRLLTDGIGVKVAATAESARKLLEVGASALVATSVRGLDLVALTRSLRASTTAASLPVFLILPPDLTKTLEDALDAGADDVLIEPLNADVLAAKLRRTLSRTKA